jgi:LmbE family N-acetylglucosaminyl deacetylase
MYELFRNKRILLIVAHPDDEVLGLGATMHRLIHEFEANVKVVILGEGITSRSTTRDVEKDAAVLAAHQSHIHKAAAFIGFQEIAVHQFPDNRFDAVPLLEIIKVVEAEKQVFQPQVIFTHHGGDLNVDHRKTFEAVVTASRPMAHETTELLITFETPSGTEWRAASDPHHFLPNWFAGITEEGLKAKCAAMECYEFEKRPFPHPRSPEALRIQAQRWGVTVGCALAEAFQLVRLVSRA